MCFLDFGKNKDGYWELRQVSPAGEPIVRTPCETAEKRDPPICSRASLLGPQVVNIIDAFEALHPDWQLLFEIGWSSGHAKHRDGSLNTNTMNAWATAAARRSRATSRSPQRSPAPFRTR
eukprot:7387630-Prymnesium_polylepis.1